MTRMTASSDRVKQFETDLAVIQRLGKQLAVIEQRMDDCRTGTPGSGFGGSGSGSGARSPVERALMGAECTCDDGDCTCNAALTADVGRAALRDLDAMLGKLRPIADQAHRMLGQWAPRSPDAKALRESAAENEVAAECTYTRNTIDRHEPAHRTSDLGGLLSAPTPLGRFVYDFARRTGKLPTPAQLTLNRQGRMVRVPVA